MTGERQAFEKFLDLLDGAVAKAEATHSPAHDFGTGVQLYRSEIHTVRAVGENPGVNVTALAEHMGVTKGAVSQMVNRLVKKGLIRKGRAPDNAREVRLELTDVGWTGFQNHERFHMEMFDTVREYFGADLQARLDALISLATDLNAVLERYGERIRRRR